MMLVGLDVLAQRRNQAKARLQGAKIAVLTHAAAVDARGASTLTVLRELGADIQVVFSPEHGLDGVQQAEEPVGKDDAQVGEARLVSLYGTTKASLAPNPELFEDISVLVVDLVDVGARYYTYVWTALLAARVAADKGVHVMVLDRPNPLSGDPFTLEGRPQDPDFLSFVGLEPIVARHALTIGELLVSQFNHEDRPLGPEGALSVVPCHGWERRRTAEAWGRPFVPPSPNMPSLETALVYPGACLLEGTNLSEGRGTTTPFRALGAPFLDGHRWAEAVGSVTGAFLRPIRFRPWFDKHNGAVCGGVMVHVTNPIEFRPLKTYLSLIWHAKNLAPEDFKFLTRVYEFESEHPAFDLLTGSAQARTLLEGDAPLEELIEAVCPVDEEWTERVHAAEELAAEVCA